MCVCVSLCVQLIVAREQATQAELKLYDIALEMHEKMSKQRDQLTSHFEVLHTSTLVNLMCYHDYYLFLFKRLRAGYSKRLEKLKLDREELLKQRYHMVIKVSKAWSTTTHYM